MKVCPLRGEQERTFAHRGASTALGAEALDSRSNVGRAADQLLVPRDRRLEHFAALERDRSTRALRVIKMVPPWRRAAGVELEARRATHAMQVRMNCV